MESQIRAWADDLLTSNIRLSWSLKCKVVNMLAGCTEISPSASQCSLKRDKDPELVRSADKDAAATQGGNELETPPACIVVLQNLSPFSNAVDPARVNVIPLSDCATSRSQYLSAMLSGRWYLNFMAAAAKEQAAGSLPPPVAPSKVDTKIMSTAYGARGVPEVHLKCEGDIRVQVSLWALELLQSRDVAKGLRSAETSKCVRLVLELLGVMQFLMFEEGMRACLEHIGQMPWTEEEEALVREHFLGSGNWATVPVTSLGAAEGAADICSRICINQEAADKLLAADLRHMMYWVLSIQTKLRGYTSDESTCREQVRDLLGEATGPSLDHSMAWSFLVRIEDALQYAAYRSIGIGSQDGRAALALQLGHAMAWLVSHLRALHMTKTIWDFFS